MTSRVAPRAPAREVVEKDTPVMIGSPAEEMLPAWARRVLASFLKQVAHVAEPGVLDKDAAHRLSRRRKEMST